MNEENRRKGYTSVSLGEDILNKIDNQAENIGANRTMMIRMILTRYYELKEKNKCDILKKEVKDIKKVSK